MKTTARDLDKLHWVDLGITQALDKEETIWPVHLPDGRRFRVFVPATSIAPRTAAMSRIREHLSSPQLGVEEIL